jgi:hypothetical protein
VRQASFWSTNAYIYVKHPNINGGSPQVFNFNRNQQVVATHIIDADFSTAASNSVPGTYIDPTSVRVTLVSEATPAVVGTTPASRLTAARTITKARPVTTVLSTTIHPRN